MEENTYHKSPPTLEIERVNIDEFNKNSLNALNSTFASYLQGLMIRTGFDSAEIELHHPTFKRYMLLTLSKSAKNLYELKSKLSKKITNEEHTALTRLTSKTDLIQLESKMDDAINLFSADLPRYLKSLMCNSGYPTSMTKENHHTYVSFFSSIITTLTNMLTHIITLKPSFHTSCQNQGKKPIQTNTLDHSNSSTCNDQNERKSAIQYGMSTKNLPRTAHSASSIQLIKSTNKSFIYYVPNNSSEGILMKVLKSECPSAKDVKNLDNELEVAKTVLHPSFRSSLNRTVYQNKQAILLEWAVGFPISEIDVVKTFNIGGFLEIAREIVSSLLAMHRKNIMHTNITCEHIILNPESKAVKIIGCGSSTSFRSKKSYISNQDLLEKDIRSISPEQTGRVNREIDFRSDFYSLGIVLYRLVTGKYPFESDDALKLVHMHILKEPVKVNTINPNVPVPISDMIFKLMKKNAEDRYLSAKGIIHDLDLMISEYVSDEKLTSVLLQQHDISETLLLPQKLYGRCNQYNSLLSAFDRVTPTSFEVVFVTGESGTGKSSLVLELYKSIAQRDGMFVYGKYHFSNSEWPYSGLLEAINNFCDDLLLKDKTTIARYKYQIQNSICDEGRILTNLLGSGFHSLIGTQPSISESIGQDAKNRFIYVFVKFIKAICLVDSPMVLVLENLQWLDFDSSNILSALLTDQSNKNLMFIGTYRENDIGNSPFRLLEDVKKTTINVTQIKLNDMDHETINELISDTLCVPPLETYSLTVFLYEKTNGNVFFLTQMIKSLSEQGSIFFCNNENRWKWDTSIFHENSFSDSVIELLRQKILSFDKDVQQTLKFASCLGSNFSLTSLKHLVNNKSIEGAISTGMITQQQGVNTIYQFVHDKTQQAAFSLISENTEKVFLSIGYILWTRFSSIELDENIFTVARLLLHAVKMISKKDSFTIASFFMQAGNKAMMSTAFEQAFKYFKTGIHLLGKGSWKSSHYDLTLNLHNATAKAAYCICNYAIMNAIIEEISKNVSSTLQLVPSYSLQIKQFMHKRMFEEAIRTAISILDKLGENVHMNPLESMITSEIVKTRRLVGAIFDEKKSEMKVLEDEVTLSIMMILSDIVYSSFLVNPQLLCLVSSKMTQITFNRGISRHSAYGLCVFGSILCSKGDQMGYRCGQLSLNLVQKVQKESRHLVYGVYYCMISPWYSSNSSSSVHSVLDPVKRMHSIGLEIGSHEATAVGASTYCMYAFLTGKNLATLLDDIEEFKPSLPIQSKLFLCINQTVLNLLEMNIYKPAIISGKIFDYRVCYDKNEKAYDISRYLVICILAAYVFNDYAAALKLAKVCRPLHKYISSFFMYPVFLFYDGLVSLASVRSCENSDEKEKLIDLTKKNISKLRKMSENAPENYQNKVHLLEAELAVVQNKKSQAVSYFQSAISLSTKHRFHHEEAIACERAGMYFLQLDSLQSASQLISQSFKCYEKWGAVAKLKCLRKKYPSILRQTRNSSFDFDSPLKEQDIENKSMTSMSTLSEAVSREKKKAKF